MALSTAAAVTIAEATPASCAPEGCRLRVRWADEEKAGALADIFEFVAEETEEDSASLPVAMDLVVGLLTATTVASMSLGAYGHMLSACVLLTAVVTGTVVYLTSATGFDLTAALVLEGDEEADEEEEKPRDVKTPVSSAAVAGEPERKRHEEKAKVRTPTPSPNTSSSEPGQQAGAAADAAEARKQVEARLGHARKQGVEATGESKSYGGSAFTCMDIAEALLTGYALLSMWLGNERQTIMAVLLLFAVVLSDIAHDASSAEGKHSERDESVDLVKRTACVISSPELAECTVELAFC
jgi:hypothetical protein